MGGIADAIGGIFSSILGGGAKPQIVKPPAAQRAAPTIDSEAAQKARRRAQLALLQQSGRASTILTDTTDKLGG